MSIIIISTQPPSRQLQLHHQVWEVSEAEVVSPPLLVCFCCFCCFEGSDLPHPPTWTQNSYRRARVVTFGVHGVCLTERLLKCVIPVCPTWVEIVLCARGCHLQRYSSASVSLSLFIPPLPHLSLLHAHILRHTRWYNIIISLYFASALTQSLSVCVCTLGACILSAHVHL